MARTAAPALASAAGPRSRVAWCRTLARIAAQLAGMAASSASTASNSSEPDIISIATVVAALAGGAHCQATANWAHMVVPTVKNTASEQVRVPRQARVPAAGSAGYPASP